MKYDNTSNSFVRSSVQIQDTQPTTRNFRNSTQPKDSLLGDFLETSHLQLSPLMRIKIVVRDLMLSSKVGQYCEAVLVMYITILQCM